MTKLLPHEKLWLRNELEAGIEMNRKASDDMTAAIESGNQWHDNAEYDEVIERMKLIDSRFGPLAREYNEREVVPYPDASSDLSELGSLITLKDDYAEFDGLIVGTSRIGESVYRTRHELDFPDRDFEVLGFESPLGAAALSATVGSTIEWEVGERRMSAEVLAVNNEWLASYVGALIAEATIEET